MDFNYWLVAVAGFLGAGVYNVVCNLVTPYVGSFLNERSDRFRLQRTERIVTRYQRVKAMKHDSAQYQIFLTLTLVRIVALMAAGGLIYFYGSATSQGMGWLFGAAARHPQLVDSMASFQATTTFCAFIMCLGTVILCTKAIEVDKWIKDFAAFEADTLKALGEERQHLISPDALA
jgi:hypothetical protein